jgi:hypothetical protein
MALLGAALVVAFALRSPSLALPHDRGDQLIWAGVARNIHERGSAGYTLRGLETGYAPIGDGAAIVSFACVEPPGALLGQFMAQGEKYWDTPLVNQPPGFFLVLLASHGVLGERGDGFPLVGRDPMAAFAWRAEFIARNDLYPRRAAEIAKLPEGEERDRAQAELEAPLFEAQGEHERALARRLVHSPPPGVVRKQLWATLPVVLADLLTVALVFVAAHMLAGRGAATIAAFAWATDPLALYCSERILSNAPLAAASALALGLEALAASKQQKERRMALAAAVGAACAAAITIKVSAVFLLPAIVFGRWMRKEADRSLAVLLAVALAPVVPWWILNMKVLGHPFGLAWRQQDDWLKVSQWGQLVTARGRLYYVETLLHSPLVALGLVVALVGWKRQPAAIVFAVLVLLAAVRLEAKEARHLLLAFPPLVVASSVALAKLATARPALRLLLAPALLLVLAWQASAGFALALDPARAP